MKNEHANCVIRLYVLFLVCRAPARAGPLLKFARDCHDSFRASPLLSSYDALNRLTQVISTTAQGYTATYAYDAIGNMTSKDEGGGSQSYGYGAAHPHAVTSVGGYAFAYDANGNMITRKKASGTRAQAWDVDNRVATMTSSAGSSATFVSDGDGKRVERRPVDDSPQCAQ